jgi:hypothetical protein
MEAVVARLGETVQEPYGFKRIPDPCVRGLEGRWPVREWHIDVFGGTD